MGSFMDTISKIGSVLGLVGSNQQENYEGYDDQGQYMDDGQGEYVQDQYDGGYENGYEEPVYEQPRASEPSHSRRRGNAQEYEQPEVNNLFARRRAGAPDTPVENS